MGYTKKHRIAIPKCYICSAPATRLLVRWGYDPEIATRKPICNRCPYGGVDSTLGYSTEPLKKG